MEDFLIVGVDVSKASLDIYFKPTGALFRIKNEERGYNKWLKELQNYLPQARLLVVMEHTGRYSNKFEMFMQSHSIDYCKVAALQIKRSLGMLRGKTDKVDAQRIAEYGWLRRGILTADPIIEKEIGELQQLLSLRSKLIRDRSGYICRLKELKATSSSLNSFESRVQQQLIRALTTHIEEIEEKIKALITSNHELSKTCDLLRSIKGVGWIVACYMISCTANFKRFSNARKFNCYAGLAPFSHESGTSIKGRARVSHFANKEAKTILNLAAFCAIRFDPELKNYYQKRVAEGKRKMSCLNIIRSKIVARMFAIIKRQTPFIQSIQAA
jgi:transposase